MASKTVTPRSVLLSKSAPPPPDMVYIDNLVPLDKLAAIVNKRGSIHGLDTLSSAPNHILWLGPASGPIPEVVILSDQYALIFHSA